MNKKRKETWDRLKQQMGNKRTATDSNRKTKSASAPHEIIVQRLASEPDNKQTFRPVQPREFVEFLYEELTLANLKKACATHFSLPATTCDVLVSNKGPSTQERQGKCFFWYRHFQKSFVGLFVTISHQVTLDHSEKVPSPPSTKSPSSSKVLPCHAGAMVYEWCREDFPPS